MASILKPKDNTYALPLDVLDPSELFAYIAEFNGFQYFDADNTGVTPNEINYGTFFVNVPTSATPILNEARMRFDGVLFIGQPADIGTDVNASTWNNGQFQNIVKTLLNYPFVKDLANYTACDYETSINNLRPLYNSVKYTKAVNCTGVEVNYSIWI